MRTLFIVALVCLVQLIKGCESVVGCAYTPVSIVASSSKELKAAKPLSIDIPFIGSLSFAPATHTQTRKAAPVKKPAAPKKVVDDKKKKKAPVAPLAAAKKPVVATSKPKPKAVPVPVKPKPVVVVKKAVVAPKPKPVAAKKPVVVKKAVPPPPVVVKKVAAAAAVKPKPKPVVAVKKAAPAPAPAKKSTATSSKTAPVTKKSSSMNFKAAAPILASAFCAAAIMYPVDLIRGLEMANVGAGAKLTTMQLLTNFKNAHGYSGFFTQGLAPELARSTWMRFIKFALFPVVHLAMHGIPESAGNGITKALAAIVASVPEAISIMPLEIAKVSLQLDAKNAFKNNGLFAMQYVYQKRGGLKAFTIGYGGVQYRQAMWSAGYFASIKYFEKGIDDALAYVFGKDVKIKYPSSIQFAQLASGFMAGVFGAALNTPGDTVRTVLQKRVLGGLDGPTTILGVAKDIVNKNGFKGLYAGFGFKAIHLGGGGALMAFLLPFFKRVFDDKKNFTFKAPELSLKPVHDFYASLFPPVVVTKPVEKKSTTTPIIGTLVGIAIGAAIGSLVDDAVSSSSSSSSSVPKDAKKLCPVRPPVTVSNKATTAKKTVGKH